MGGYIRKNYDFLYIQGKTNFKVDFRVPEVSQRLDIEITLQMAFGRARGDFSRPESGTGILDPTFWNAYKVDFPKENLGFAHKKLMFLRKIKVLRTKSWFS